MEILVGSPMLLPRHRDLLKDPFNQSHPLVEQGSHLQSVRRHYTAAGVSKEASDFLLAGWSKGTNATYQSGWAKWSVWCSEWEVDPIAYGIKPLLDFFADFYGQGLQYRTINTIRSAVSMTHNTIENIPIGQYPLVSRLMKGIYNSRPPEPWYSTTWDVSYQC